MPSSTSNSETTTARYHWTRTWLLTMLMLVVSVCTIEFTLRSLGHRPSVVDDMDLWANVRETVPPNDPHAVVLIGASRIQLGFYTEVFRKRFTNYKLYQLAINGRHPILFLKDLANDPTFTGILICTYYSDSVLPSPYNDEQGYIDAYHNRSSPNRRINRNIATFLQERLVIINPWVRLVSIGQSIVKNKSLPSPNYLITLADRSRLYDFNKKSREAVRKNRKEKSRHFTGEVDRIPVDEWLRKAHETEQYVKKIQSRGGQVIFLHMPISGRLLEQDKLCAPKKDYWDQFARQSSAICIHFEDIESLKNFHCPDDSHLDQRDAPRFTNALLDELVKRNILEPPRQYASRVQQMDHSAN